MWYIRKKGTVGMSKWFCVFVCMFIFGCGSQPPKFTNVPSSGKVISKIIPEQHGKEQGNLVAIYKLDNKSENSFLGVGWGPIEFMAPIGFARVGDYIICSNNVIMSYSSSE